MKPIVVTNMKKVDTTRYVDGQVFIAEKEIGILHNGKIEPMIMQKDMKEYVKKKDVLKMINDALKKVSE